MTDNLSRERVRQAVDRRLSGLQPDPLLAGRIMSMTRQPAPPPRSLAVLLAAALLLSLLAATAAASGLVPGLLDWLRARPDAARLSAFPGAPAGLGQITVGGVTLTCTEAIADDRTFLCSVAAESAGLCDVSIDAAYQGHTQEICRQYANDDGCLILMSEGFHGGDAAGPMIITVTVRRGSETAAGTLTVTPRIARTLEDRTLAAPIDLGGTGYTLSALNLHRTELRTYLNNEVTVGLPPVSIAIKRPQVVLLDSQGQPLSRWWPYDQPLPEPITVQLWDASQTELLCEYTLTDQDWKEVPAP